MVELSEMQLFGFAYGGPVGHLFHKLMDIIFKGKKDNKTIAKKVADSWSSSSFILLYILTFSVICYQS